MQKKYIEILTPNTLECALLENRVFADVTI
jgi:hypothetical protein